MWKREDGRVLLCLGAGGVGKTTTACALAIQAAYTGRDVEVLTVDPAPRLLDALGLDQRSAAPQAVELGAGAGRLRALKLDPKTTFDAVIRRHAPSVAVAEGILANRLYRDLSTALTWVGDFMAMEKLLELYSESATGLIVIDTPPAEEAFAFLDAPRRLLDLLNSRATTLLGSGLDRGLRLSDLAARGVLSAFDRFSRLHLLADVQSFVQSFAGMYQGFAQRAARVAELLRSEQAAVLVVTSATTVRIQETADFLSALRAANIRVNGVLVNRITAPIGDPPRMAGDLAPALRRKLLRNWRDFAALKQREERALSGLQALIPSDIELLCAPELGHQLSNLADLAKLARAIAPLRPSS
ncbi:MAG TPA: ArsA-related P-loop ATPase [Candidatus Binataceae bacterium]|nr:ArsA-related P-loop ATPase [Candidatus Binataceae bacterium]